MAVDDWFVTRSYRPCTITIAVPGVVSSDEHSLLTGDKVVLQTTGALPTGLSVDTYYYAIQGTYADGTTDPDTFKLATSLANAKAGTAITTTTSQSGAHYYAPIKHQRLTPSTDSNE